MKHIIPFRNCPVTWDNALAMGNGNFGAMLYFEDNKLLMPMNHYEVYYTSNDRPMPEDVYAQTPLIDDPGARHRSFAERADRNQPVNDEPYISYRTDRATYDKDTSYGRGKCLRAVRSENKNLRTRVRRFFHLSAQQTFQHRHSKHRYHKNQTYTNTHNHISFHRANSCLHFHLYLL